MKAARTVYRVAVKGENIATMASGIVENAKIISDPDAGWGAKLLAATDMALDVTTGFRVKDVKQAMKSVGKGLETLEQAAKQIKQKAETAKKTGRHGGPEHREKVSERAAELKAEGYEITAGGGQLPERAVKTPEGKKRFPDISAKDPSGKPYHENVGKTTSAGDPIKREREALADIERATGTKPVFTPYDKPKATE